MTRFQLIAGAVLVIALARDLLLRSLPLSWRARLVRSLVWLAALIAILNPDAVTRFANLLGIGRGADIVLYIFVLACVAMGFYFYTQQLKLRRDLSVLAGQIAARDAQFGGTPPTDEQSAGARSRP